MMYDGGSRGPHKTQAQIENDILSEENDRLKRRAENAELALRYQTENYERVNARCEVLEAENLQLRHSATTELLERLVTQLHESGAKNYQECVFDLEMDSEVLEASVIIRHAGSPGPHELRQQAERECDELKAQLTESRANDRTAMGYLNDVRAIVGGTDFPEMVRRVRDGGRREYERE